MDTQTFDMTSLRYGQLVEGKQGGIYVYLGQLPWAKRFCPQLNLSDLYPHLLTKLVIDEENEDGPCCKIHQFVTRDDNGKVYITKSLDTDDDIVRRIKL